MNVAGIFGSGLLALAFFIWLDADLTTHMGRASRFTGSVFWCLFFGIAGICALGDAAKVYGR